MDEIKNLLENPDASDILTGLCLVFFVFQIYYIVFVHGKLAFLKTENLPENEEYFVYPPLSVIICTRNEEALIKENLAAILEQDYPLFEVIVVNDRSEDDTKWILQDFQAQYPHLKVSDIKEHVLSKVGKKFGVAMGIKAAQYEHLVFTDIACIPNSTLWLKHMSYALKNEKEIVLGFTPMMKRKGLKNLLIRFEHHYNSINYLSYALKKKAYMGLGQNMAYLKELFYKGKGFASHIHITSGYDALFVNQHANKENTKIVIHPDAHIWKPAPVQGLGEMIYKDQRLATSNLFKSSHKRMLNFQAVAGFFFLILLLITLILFPAQWKWIAGIYIGRLIIQMAIYFPIVRKLKIKQFIAWLPLFDLIQTLSRGWNALFGKSKLYSNG